MIFESTEDDDLFFAPKSSTSHLSELFGTNMTNPSSSGSSSLTYTAPKKPLSKSGDLPKSSLSSIKHQSSLIIFKEIYAFKLEDKHYSPQGRCGLALIGNEDVQLYQLLIYKQKNNIISMTKISTEFEFIIQKNNYVSIVDDNKINWTIHFSNESDLNDFSQVLEKRGSQIIIKSEIKNEIGLTEKKIDVQPSVTEKISEATNMPEETAIGKDEIATNDESDNSVVTSKSVILSRMAKMGQKMFPKTSTPLIRSDESDSDKECDKIPRKSTRRIRKFTAPEPTTSNDETSNQLSINSTTSTAYLKPPTNQQYILVNGQCIPVMQPSPQSSVIGPMIPGLTPYNQPMLPAADSSSMLFAPPQISSEQLNMFFVENRTHNSELRMSLMRLSNKMEEVLDKIKNVDSKNEISTQTPLDADKSEFENKNKDLTAENEKLKISLIEFEKSLSDMKIHQDVIKKKNEDLLRKDFDHLKTIDELSEETAKNAYQENKLQIKIQELQTQLNNQQLKILDYEEKFGKLNYRNMDSVLVKKEKLATLNENIKKHMNMVYNELAADFKDDQSFEGCHINKLIMQKIVRNTYELLALVKDTVRDDTHHN